MTDPFTADAQRRAALADKAMRIRLALYEARESRSGEEALAAIDALYAFVEAHDGAQILDVGEHSVALALPTTCMQMTARWGGICILCDDRIGRGDVMYWDREGKSMTCARCSVKELTGQR